MDKQKLQFYFLIIILTITGVFAFLIFKPFLLIIILAMIFAVVFEPVQRKMRKLTKDHRGFSAVLTILVILIFIFIPLIFFGAQIFKEAGQLYSYFANNGGGNHISTIGNDFINKLQDFLPQSQKIVINFNQYLKQILEWLFQNVGLIFSNIAKIILGLFIFLFALYYFLKEGQTVKDIILRFSPLIHTDNETILEKLKLAINSVVKGTLLVALVQGILTIIGFSIFGIPNAILWGSLAVIAALVPTIGTGLVIVPGIIYLFLTGPLLSAVGLLLWGFVAVGLIDNFLGPKIMSKGMKMNPLIVLLSVLGGIIFFGPLGFLLGPLIINLLFTLIDIYLLRKNK